MSYGMGRYHFIDKNEKPPKLSKDLLFRALRYFSPYKKQMSVAIIAILIAAVLGLIPPLLLKTIVDTALPQQDLKLLGFLIVISISSTILLSLVQVGQTYINTWIAKHIIFNIKNDMYDHLEHMSMDFFSTAKPGEITTRMNSDIDGIQGIFNSTVVSALNSMFIFLTTAVALFSMNWKLALVSMATLPLFVFPTRKVGKVRWKIATESQEKLSELNQLVQETLSVSGSILMKVFTKEKDEYRKFEKINYDVIKLQIRESLAGRWFIMTISIFTAIGPMLVYFFGGVLMVYGELTIGEIIAFATLLTKLYGPVTQLSNIHIDVTRSFALFDRIFEYLDKKQDVADLPEARKLTIKEGVIEFDQVSFSYNESREALHNITFSAAPGQMTALVGPSGAGKTTITNLIPRLYDATDGKIYIDGQEIREVTLDSLREQIGIVMQEPYLFNGTIRENLLYGKANATNEEIIEACKAAHVHDFIMSLPEGYDAVVGNRGIKLSGGEKQRVSIARVILKNPRIIIFDEATSSLDSVSEHFIQQAMVPLFKGRTSLVIAHRLSTILAADKILVVDGGHIADSGRHEELLSHGGLYKDLYETQFEVQVTNQAE